MSIPEDTEFGFAPDYDSPVPYMQRTRLLSRISGGFMIGGGIWLALTRAR